MRTENFPTETAGVVESVAPELAELSDGEEFELRIAPVTKELGGATVRMLAYNSSIPGPTLKVRQGSEIVVNVVNEGDLDATVHWHGIRVENRLATRLTNGSAPSASRARPALLTNSTTATARTG